MRVLCSIVCLGLTSLLQSETTLMDRLDSVTVKRAIDFDECYNKLERDINAKWYVAIHAFSLPFAMLSWTFPSSVFQSPVRCVPFR